MEAVLESQLQVHTEALRGFQCLVTRSESDPECLLTSV